MVKKGGSITNGILAHLLGLFTGFLGPLIMFFVVSNKRDKDHVKNALNWQFSLAIYWIATFILMMVLIGFLLIPILFILNIVFSIIATVKAGEGKLWKYPLSIRFFKV